MSKNTEVSKEKRGLVELLAVKSELPADILTGGFRIELRGRNTMYMQGCRRILKYSESEMVMATMDFDVRVMGRRLICSSYHTGAVAIEGEIEGFQICGER